MVIGVVGKIGSGKSAVVEYLQENYGAIAFSCDEVAKEIMREGDFDTSTDTNIFTNENLLEKLRIVLHPKVFLRINENINILYNYLEKYEFSGNKNCSDAERIENELNLNIFSNIMNKNNFNILFELINEYKSKDFETLEFCKNKTYILNKNNFSNKIHKNNEFRNELDIENSNLRIDKNLNNFKNDFKLFNILIIIESALPSEDMFKICDKMIYIDSPYEARVSRLKESRNCTDDKIKLIYDSQSYYEKFYDRADYKIMNDGTKEDLRNKVKEVMNEICIASK